MYNNIPKYLQDLDNWLCYDARDLENPKAPRDLQGNLLKQWTSKGYSFKECLDSIKSGKNSGLGLVLKNNGIVVIDYDKVVSRVEINKDLGYCKPIFTDKDKETSIMEDINRLRSYTELSPSNTGIHIVLLTDIKDITQIKPIEIYSKNKFIRFSGNSIFDFELEYANNELLEVMDKYSIDTTDAKQLRFSKSVYNDFIKKNFKYSNGLSDREILDKLFNGANGDFIKKLYNNELLDSDYIKYKQNKINRHLQSGYISKTRQEQLLNRLDVSNSGKAYTLILYLFDACYGDLQAIERLFKKSALCKQEYLKQKYTGDSKLYKIDKVEYMIKQAIIGKEDNRYKNYRYWYKKDIIKLWCFFLQKLFYLK